MGLENNFFMIKNYENYCCEIVTIFFKEELVKRTILANNEVGT